MQSNVPVAEATVDEMVLPERVQDALGDLVGAAREGLLALSVSVGLGVLSELLEEEVTELVGPKGRWNRDRSAVRHGHEDGGVTLGGRRVVVRRPRVRTADGESELPLVSYQHFADRDPLGRVVLERVLAGVSTRKYRRAQDPVGAQAAVRERSTSKSSVSRAFVERTREALWQLMSRQLADLRLAVVMLDGIEIRGDERRCVRNHDRRREARLGLVGRHDGERDRGWRAALRPSRPRAGRRAGSAVRDRWLQGALNAVANFEFECLIDRICGPRRRNQP